MDKIILPGLSAVSDGLFHLWNVRSYTAFPFPLAQFLHCSVWCSTLAALQDNEKIFEKERQTPSRKFLMHLFQHREHKKKGALSHQSKLIV